MTNEERCARAAGRTDAGVHARGQVVGVETERAIPLEGFRRGLCALTPSDLSVLRIEEVEAGFDARRMARGKHYRYRFLTGPCPSALRHRFTYWVARPLDAEVMATSARHLLGQHDFRAFRAADDDRENSVRTLTRLDVTRVEDEIVCDVHGDAFLKNMIRIIAGTLMLVGLGRKHPDWVAEVLAGTDRGRAGPTAPACGLCLMEVFY
jgi:tRNA pseudouridine38-40 synthase